MRESLFWVTFQTSAASVSCKAAFCCAIIDDAMQCQSGALVERWSLPPTPCDAFAQVAQDDFLPFCCDDVDFPIRQPHSDLSNHFLCTRRPPPAVLPALSQCLSQDSIATLVLAGLQPDQIHIRHPTGSLYGVGLLQLCFFSWFPVSVLSNP